MCKLWEDRLKIETDVLAEERAEEIGVKLLKIGKLSIDEIAVCSGISSDRVAEPAKTA